jgi:hypothetical protein
MEREIYINNFPNDTMITIQIIGLIQYDMIDNGGLTWVTPFMIYTSMELGRHVAIDQRSYWVPRDYGSR